MTDHLPGGDTRRTETHVDATGLLAEVDGFEIDWDTTDSGLGSSTPLVAGANDSIQYRLPEEINGKTRERRDHHSTFCKRKERSHHAQSLPAGPLMIGADESFDQSYFAEWADAPPAGSPDHVISVEGAPRCSSYLSVVPHSNAPAWNAVVTVPGPLTGRAMTGLCGCPSSHDLCVVLAGTALLLDTRSPDEFLVVRADEPVVAVEALVTLGQLLLLTAWSITAVDRAGAAIWTTPRLAIDGLRADEVRDGWLLGVADPDQEGREFAVRLRDGCARGGAGVAGTRGPHWS